MLSIEELKVEVEKARNIINSLAEGNKRIIKEREDRSPFNHISEIFGVNAEAFMVATVPWGDYIDRMSTSHIQKQAVRFAAPFLLGFLLGSGKIQLPEKENEPCGSMKKIKDH